MIIKYVGEDEQQPFHEEVTRLLNEGHCLFSPGGAAHAIGVSRQRIHQIVEDDRHNVRAWAYYEDRRRLLFKPKKILTYMYVSMDDLLRYAIAIGRIDSQADLEVESPRLNAALEIVKRETVDSV